MEPTPLRRDTRQRRLVYAAVAGSRADPTAEWVHQQVRRQLPRISLGTVYRNLQLLVSEGRLRAWTRGRSVRFDADLKAHDHFVCESCGLLVDLDRAPEAPSTEKTLKTRGYLVRERILEFVGLCRNCRRGRISKRWEGEKRRVDGVLKGK
ncbi:MAG TPA: transcriptional repressor [Thermoanaerobaculia bacterium]